MYSENIIYKICYHCAPVILGIKSANTITILNTGLEDLYYIADKIKIELIKLYDDNQKSVLMLYKRKILENIINCGQTDILLKKFGYKNLNLDKKLMLLRYRFYEYKFYKKDFPHEMGLFLNYPPHDVIGFMKNNGKKNIFAGYWKVYENKADAANTFKRYDEAREFLLNVIFS